MSAEWMPEGFTAVGKPERRRSKTEPKEQPAYVPDGFVRVPEKRQQKDDLGAAHDVLIKAILSNPSTYAYGELIPPPDATHGGRPRTYPLWLWFFFSAYADVCNSVRRAFSNMQSELFWELVGRVASETLGVAPEQLLPAKAPDRSWYHKTRERRITPHRQEIRLAQAEFNLTATRAMGLLDPDKPFDLGDRTRFLFVDGNVLTPLTKAMPGDTVPARVINKATGEIREVRRPVRFDPDAKSHLVGDGRQVHGVKHWHLDVRGKGTHHMAIIMVDHVPAEKDQANSENHIMMKNLRVLASRAPGVIGVVTDGISHGAETDEMQRNFSWVPVAAAKVDKESGKRLAEKEGPLGRVEFPDCRLGSVELWYRQGRLTKRVDLEDGTSTLVDLAWKNTITRANKNGTYRRDVEYEVPCHCGAHSAIHSERTITNEDDRARKLNRGENVRAIPPGTELFAKLYPFRSAIEGQNSQIDNHLPLRRARSYGAARQQLDLIGHAHQVTSYGLFLYGLGGKRHHEIDLAEAA